MSFFPIDLLDNPKIYSNPDPWEWRTHLKDYYNLWVLLKGRVHLRTEHQEWRLSAISGVLLPPGTTVYARLDNVAFMANFAAHFRLSSSSKLHADEFQLPDKPMTFRFPDPVFVEERLHEACARARRSGGGSLIEAEALVLLLLRDVLRGSSASTRRPARPTLDTLLALIEARPGAFQRMEDLCAVAKVSPAQLRRQFLAQTSFPPMEYLLRAKLERACLLLQTSSLSIAEIANSVGFADAFYFSRLFRQRTGCPPSVWRKAQEHSGGTF